MPALPANVEPSAFRPGEYVCYAHGAVWRIRRRLGGGWRANRTVDGLADAGAGFIFAATLARVAAKVDLPATLARQAPARMTPDARACADRVDFSAHGAG